MEVESHKGKLLLASRQLGDSNFNRTIVLLVQHDENGAMGLVLNRALEVTVSEACGSDVTAAMSVDAPIHEGGPCPGPLMVVFSDDDEEECVVPGVRFAADRELIEAVMLRDDGAAKYFAGYSGWGPGQLESEIEQGAWMIAPAVAVDIFSDDANLWSRLAAKATIGKWIDVDRIPDDPSVN